MSLFPTLVHTARAEDTFIPILEEACWMIEDGDMAGHDWCEREGYPGYTSYASLDDLPQRAPAFADLVDMLDREAEKFAAALHWDIGAARLKLDSLWINILGEGGHHSGHIHPNSVLSGTIYVAMPDGAGGLKLEDPRLVMMMAAPQLTKDAPETVKRFFYLQPRPGDIVIWESWLRHEVMTSQNEEARITVSFNYTLVDVNT
ncbi:MAG: hypothetical protein GYB42_06205 [Alphaproteobacteria bacterium]|nr:hypothetical protein [Alphaproteobacteria bacterium]